MSDYSQITDFSAKDALSAGDPDKLVKGSDLDGELTSVALAIASKYDSSDLATQEEAEAGSSNGPLMTPLRVSQFLDGAMQDVVTKVKTSAETVNNSTTFQNDDDLAGFTIPTAGEWYLVTGLLICAFKAASDFKMRWSFSQVPQDYFAQLSAVGPTTIDFDGSNSYASTLTITDGTDEEMAILVRMVFQANASTPGTVGLQWAQNTAVAENTQLLAGSYMTLTKLT